METEKEQLMIDSSKLLYQSNSSDAKIFQQLFNIMRWDSSSTKDAYFILTIFLLKSGVDQKLRSNIIQDVYEFFVWINNY